MTSPTDEYYGKLLEGFGEYTINGFRTKVGESWDRKTTEQRFEIAVESGLSERDSKAVSKSPFSDITPYLREKLEQAELFESFKDKTIEDVNSEFKVDAKPEWYNPNADRNDGSRTPIDEFGTADDDENYSKLTGYIPNPNGIFEGGTVAKEAKASEIMDAEVETWYNSLPSHEQDKLVKDYGDQFSHSYGTFSALDEDTQARMHDVFHNRLQVNQGVSQKDNWDYTLDDRWGESKANELTDEEFKAYQKKDMDDFMNNPEVGSDGKTNKQRFDTLMASLKDEGIEPPESSDEGWQEDSQAISRISFDPNLSQEEKNKRISEIEKRMEQEEQKDLDGKGTGYFTEATDFRIRHFLKRIQDAGGRLRFDDRTWGDMKNVEDAKLAKDVVLLGLARDENEGNYSTLGNHTFNLVITPEGLGELQDGVYGGIDDSSYRGSYSEPKTKSQKALGSPVYGEANDDIFDGRADHELPNVLSGDVEDISRVGDEDERLKQMHGLGWNVESKSDLDFANQEQSAEGKYEMWESEGTEEGNHDGTVWSDFHGKWVDEDVLSKDRKARGFKSESWGEFEGGEDISDNEADEIYEFLFDLQQSGRTNMFNAGPYVESEFPHYDKDTVRKYVINWMNNYESIASRMGR
jgi:hypothetical protein